MTVLLDFIPLYVLVLYIPGVDGNKCTSKFQVSSVCNTTYGTQIDVIHNVNSVAGCVNICSVDKACRSVMYDGLKKQCSVNSGTIQPKLATNCNYKYASLQESTCRTLSNLGVRCTNSSECMGSNVTCRDSLCKCDHGFSQGVSSCVISCSPYGDTFEHFPGYLLSGYNNKIMNEASVTECINACLNETTFECVTAEMSLANNQCYLSEETPLTQPQSYLQSPDYDLYLRNCALDIPLQ